MRYMYILLLILVVACAQAEQQPTLTAEAPAISNTETPLPPTAAPMATETATDVPQATGDAAEITAPPVSDATAVPTATPVPLPTTAPEPVSALELEQIASGLQRPVYVTHAGDERLFIVEQPGRIRIAVNDELLGTPFLAIEERVNDQSNEQGLLGLSFHPAYGENGRFFIYYTAQTGAVTVSEFQVSADDPNRADPSTERVLLTVGQPFPNHNGGQIAFGPDGYLYAGIGDGGSAGDPQNNGQNIATLLGSVIRIDVDGDRPYAVPGDNPFVAIEGARPEIWAWGLRNPWRFSFDRAGGDLLIADVGQNAREEVNYQPAGSGGSNYGWNGYEGSLCYQGICDSVSDSVFPVLEYGHDSGCSVTGGYIYRGSALPQLQGNYLYADYCSGIIWRALPGPDGGAWESATVYDADFLISSFGEDAAGELYVVDHGGSIYQIVGAR